MKICPNFGKRIDCNICFHGTPHEHCPSCNSADLTGDICVSCVDCNSKGKVVKVKTKSTKTSVQTSTQIDKENIGKAADTAHFLLDELKVLITSENPYLSDIGIELLEVAVKIEQKLKRIKSYK